MSEGTATYDHGTVSVEHVLPQTPPAGSEWTRQFDGEATRRAYLHKLGNLVLLSRSRNSKARNLPFAEKKAKYFSADGGGSPFVLTSGVLKEPEWTPDVVERRQADLLSALARHWRLDLARWRDGAGNTDDDQALDTSVLAYLARSGPRTQGLFEKLNARLLASGDVERHDQQSRISYDRTDGGRVADVKVQPATSTVVALLNVDPSSVDLRDGFTRDVRGIGRHGAGGLELRLRSDEDLAAAEPLIVTSYTNAA